MTIAEDIRANARTTFVAKWTVRDGITVPEPADLKLSNDAVHFKRATILYADLDGSTDLVEKKKWAFSGEAYKAFLYATSRLLRRHGGTIVSYDGDRAMGIFISNDQSNDAVSCAPEINYAIKNIVQAEISKGWTTDFKIRHVVGIDTSEIYAARTGVRGDNDIVWIGNAANLAAKLTTLTADNPTWITKRVYELLKDNQKLGSNAESIWKKWKWTQHNDDEVYSTTYWRTIT
ncbi:adenylate/guanylate cyclase domain-containing protein [Rhizobium ruizarguesonis]|uniref:Adenylate/guanylate cyclase domain-containing protein n=1 Tax=Rhizobium ruizarguesonis TaxID=2081791 RepID=A0ABY1WVY0_9HYPH|nr:adenylate/guanylate cyclase domain-containing protein [Rhizobium ruizarguesonis]TAU13113.1 adenylate/guanylate cyclase domain-containing protein [Rhizobium ruizarguesonis]TAU57016.1 adenylate/guanylate cyclase domain-containing protein [Rhizobium ruizarguesonis]TAV18846.1 adenylate/guanylate cyclase domain-containing protein [Rhizobium ruizarguesonis]TAV18892.1 adenylate/guanylate cyclase domain-containing protein [Rhizobium ruizarguesonis]TAW01860.1 adenylate/guanylate cyclase domain-conta